MIVAGDDGEILEESESDATDGAGAGDGRPDDCDCAPFMADEGLPCWPCWREGFREPNPNVEESR